VQKDEKEEEEKKELTHISETLYAIFFKFGAQSPLVGWHLYSNF